MMFTSLYTVFIYSISAKRIDQATRKESIKVCKMTPLETFGVIMKNFQLYVGGVNDINYRYDIQKAGDIFNVRIFIVDHHVHRKDGAKRMQYIGINDVIDECLSHYKKNANSVKGILRWLRIR